MVLGTPDYIAPEQARDPRQADIRANVYSLGCTLYYLLAGEVPFPGETITEKLAAHGECVATPLGELRAEVPAEVVAIADRMMAKEPGERYQTPVEVARALVPFAPKKKQAPMKRSSWPKAILDLLSVQG